VVDLTDRRVLVVGASAGIGRVIGQHLCERGAHVAFAARRGSVCEEAATEAKGTAVGVACDVTQPESCAGVVEDTVDRLGGLDDLVYATGLISLVALAHAEADLWRRTLETNVLGAALVTKAALSHLQRSGGTAVYLSSVSGHTGPWPGIGVYTSSKAALNRLIDTWRAEHPDVGFTRIGVGPTDSGASGAEWDVSAAPHQARWPGMGLTSGALIDPMSIARVVALVLGDPARVWDVTVQPRDPGLPWSEDQVGAGAQLDTSSMS
jgi:NAD(P)-dependent dehydrogenase (short-subunit alcohol dehydrogenase family)